MLVEKYTTERGIDTVIRIFPDGKSLCDGQEMKEPFDLIFLDIMMGHSNGMNVAEQLRQMYPDVCIVFVTAHIQYAPEGYKLGAARYLMKDSMDVSITECMDYVMGKMKEKSASVEVSFGKEKQKILLKEICYIESKAHKCVFHLKNPGQGEKFVYEKLDRLEEKLDKNLFLRIHKSYLVHMKYIKKISNYQVFLWNGRILPVAKVRFPQIKERYAAYKGGE